MATLELIKELEDSLITANDNTEDGEDEWTLMGIFYIHLITGVSLISQVYEEEDDDTDYWMVNPMRVVEDFQNDGQYVKFMTFNPFVRQQFFSVSPYHIVYMAEVSEDIVGKYLEYINSMEEDDEPKEDKVIKKQENVVTGNFASKKTRKPK